MEFVYLYVIFSTSIKRDKLTATFCTNLKPISNFLPFRRVKDKFRYLNPIRTIPAVNSHCETGACDNAEVVNWLVCYNWRGQLELHIHAQQCDHLGRYC